MNQYAVADLISHLEGNKKVPGWCFASKDWIAEELGISRATVFRAIDLLLQEKLLEKNEETSHLRTTTLWFETVVISKKKREVLPQSPSQNETASIKLRRTVSKRDPDRLKMRLYKDITKKKKKYIKKKINREDKKLEGSKKFLESPPDGYVQKLSEEYSIPVSFIMEELDTCLNWLGQGKRKKNYNLFFRNWVKNGWRKLPDWKKQSITAPPKLDSNKFDTENPKVKMAFLVLKRKFRKASEDKDEEMMRELKKRIAQGVSLGQGHYRIVGDTVERWEDEDWGWVHLC